MSYFLGRRTTRSGLIILALVLATGCGHRESAEPRGAAPVPVGVQALTTVLEPATVEAVGSLQAVREATLSSKVMGNVTGILRHAGDAVRQGETLLTIDARDVTGQIAQAEGAMAQAKAAEALAETNFHRYEQLQARGSASPAELDQARYQYDTARGAVEQAEGAVAAARSYQSYAVIPAPFSGRVVDQLCQVGDMAAPGHPLMKMEDPMRLRLFASLEASRADAAVPGTSVAVRLPSLADKVCRGVIVEVVPEADPATRTLLVKIDLEPDPALRSGLFARAQLASGQRPVLRVPRSAVIRRGGITGVFVASSGRAAYRMVVLADESGDAPEVLSGLAAGDSVITAPPAGLEVDCRVEVRS